MNYALNEEIHAPHDDDFDEHMNMSRTHSFKSKTGGFVHMYQKRPGARTPDSSETLGAIMKYHGYDSQHSKDRTKLEYSKDEPKQKHRVSASLDKKGDVSSIMHHEDFKSKNESITEMKKLRAIVPKSQKLDINSDSALDTPTAPGEKEATRKFLSLDKILSWPDRNGNEDDFATKKSPKKKDLGPGVGTKMAPEKIKEDLDEDTEELDESFEKQKSEGYGRQTKEQSALGRHISKSLGSSKVHVRHHEKGGLDVFSKLHGKPGNNKHVREMSKHLDSQGIPHRYEENEGWGRHRDRLYVMSSDAHEHGKKHVKGSADAIHHDRERLLAAANEEVIGEAHSKNQLKQAEKAHDGDYAVHNKRARKAKELGLDRKKETRRAEQHLKAAITARKMLAKDKD